MRLVTIGKKVKVIAETMQELYQKTESTREEIDTTKKQLETTTETVDELDERTKRMEEKIDAICDELDITIESPSNEFTGEDTDNEK
jgi:uncharacterized coiled-coil DUF342 family protein